MLKLENLSKSYSINKSDHLQLLKKLNLDFLDNKFYCIIGHSGSGKSTLINIIGLIDSFDDSKYFIVA